MWKCCDEAKFICKRINDDDKCRPGGSTRYSVCKDCLRETKKLALKWDKQGPPAGTFSQKRAKPVQVCSKDEEVHAAEPWALESAYVMYPLSTVAPAPVPSPKEEVQEERAA